MLKPLKSKDRVSYYNPGNIISNKHLKTHCFIFSWEGWSNQAEKLEENFKQCNLFDKITVINSDPDNQLSHWVNLDEDAFFGRQWEAALSEFEGDLFFHIQADVKIPNSIGINKIIESAIYYFNNLNCSIYAPDIDFTGWSNEKACISKDMINFLGFPSKILAAINTDCSCWFIDSKTLQEFKEKYLNDFVELSPLGWGVSSVMAGIGWKNKMPVIRDLSHELLHPKFTNYSQSQAMNGLKFFINSIKDEYVADFMNKSFKDPYSAKILALKSIAQVQ